jgi:hypothetical protein
MENGAPRRNRTADPIITNDVLYQLSYRGAEAGVRERERGRKAAFSAPSGTLAGTLATPSPPLDSAETEACGTRQGYRTPA